MNPFGIMQCQGHEAVGAVDNVDAVLALLCCAIQLRRLQ